LQQAMADTHLTTRDAEVIIDGGRVPGRTDLDGVVALAAFMRASREVEPAPPMNAHLIWQIDVGSLPQN
jgi:hypothetical protein